MDMKTLRAEALEWARTALGAFAVYLAFTTVAFAQYAIPSESMVPHLEVGDRVAVSKFAYGYSRHSLPFNLGAQLPAARDRLFAALPRRGDVAVFVHPRTGDTMIKRIVGLPGDEIVVRDGVLWINGEEARLSPPHTLLRLALPERRREFAERREEALPGGLAHAVHNLTNHGDFDEFGPYVVPAGHVFAMGDNRDNSLDSRWSGMGPVPVENLIGRAELVHVTGGDCRDHTVACPMPRWLRAPHL
ncbi:MAG: signal peptidase I [Hyphomonadaceae bacterium]|nr:signal peptidase I [Hyphomonadaceae bacterium]